MRLLFLTLISLAFACENTGIDYNSRTSYFKNIRLEEETSDTLTILTFNIRLGFEFAPPFNDPWNKDEVGADMNVIDSIAFTIKNSGADIIALQEVPRNRSNAVIKNFTEVLATKLNMNYCFGSHGYNDPYEVDKVKGEWGNAILSKLKIEEIENYEVEYKSKWERRSILRAKLQRKDNYLDVISLHFIPSEEAIPNLIQYLSNLNSNTIVTGDYNMSQKLLSLENIGFKDIDAEQNNFYIDRIFIEENSFSVIDYGEYTGNGFKSDHPANYCKFKFKE